MEGEEEEGKGKNEKGEVRIIQVIESKNEKDKNSKQPYRVPV
jgi:hypothetical protein